MPDVAGAPHPATLRKRHALLKIDPQAWPALLSGHPFAYLPRVASWAERGWPVIVRRPSPEDDPARIAVGIPLPPAEGKLRIALGVPQESVIAQEPLPRLDRVRAVAPPAWHSAIAALIGLGERFGAPPSCYGSLCWELLTGLPYVTPASDLDVFWPAAAIRDVLALLEAIADTERSSGVRIDGEISLSGARAVNWRELHRALGKEGTAHVLVKTLERADLCPVDSLLAESAAA
jgi:phosphoribosyl-dephospho-CoA transferase